MPNLLGTTSVTSPIRFPVFRFHTTGFDSTPPAPEIAKRPSGVATTKSNEPRAASIDWTRLPLGIFQTRIELLERAIRCWLSGQTIIPIIALFRSESFWSWIDSLLLVDDNPKDPSSEPVNTRLLSGWIARAVMA